MSGCETISGWFEDAKPIVYVDIRARDPALDRAVNRASLEAAMKEVLADLPGFEFRNAKPGEVAYQLALVVEQVTERTADPTPQEKHGTTRLRRSLGVSLELFATSGDRRRYAAEAFEARDMERNEALETLAEAVVVKAGLELQLALKLDRASDSEIVAMLADSDPSRRGRAIAIAGRRRLMAARTGLEAILKDSKESEPMILKAIGSLVQIGDPEAVSALIDCGRNRGTAYQTQIIFAVSQLGGKEAEAYLFTLESGHPDPAVREVASQALKELEARRAAAQPAPG